MTHIQPTHPENDVFSDVGGVVSDALEMPGGEDELQARADEGGLPGHASKQIFEDAVSVLVDDVVTLEDLGSHFDIAENERAEALADHRAHGYGHGSEFLRNARAGHFAQGNGALREIDREV